MIEPSTVRLSLEIDVLLRLERVTVSNKQQQIISLHSNNLLCRHELLTLFRVRKIHTIVRDFALPNLLRIDSAFPEVARSPFGGFDIIEVEDALGEARPEDRAVIDLIALDRSPKNHHSKYHL